jgi:hypothetical protein
MGGSETGRVGAATRIFVIARGDLVWSQIENRESSVAEMPLRSCILIGSFVLCFFTGAPSDQAPFLSGCRHPECPSLLNIQAFPEQDEVVLVVLAFNLAFQRLDEVCPPIGGFLIQGLSAKLWTSGNRPKKAFSCRSDLPNKGPQWPKIVS